MNWKKVTKEKEVKNLIEIDFEYWMNIVLHEIDQKQKERDYPWLYPKRNN
jgi:hypothetical protein